jgi:hypothetical protein
MLDTANPSDLLLIQIMTGLRHRYESLNRRYEEELVNDFGANAPGKFTRSTWSGFFSRGRQLRWNLIRSAMRKARQSSCSPNWVLSVRPADFKSEYSQKNDVRRENLPKELAAKYNHRMFWLATEADRLSFQTPKDFTAETYSFL